MTGVANTLDGCLPATRTAYAKLHALAAQSGISIGVADYGGLRTQAITEQLIAWRDEAVAAGEPSYRVAAWGESFHDFGAAFDIVVIVANGVPDPYDVLGAGASLIGCRWGGDFPPPRDVYHYELDISLDDARALYAAMQPESA